LLSEHATVSERTKADLCRYTDFPEERIDVVYEGFGLPVLESMACGTPVVGGSVGAVPEIAAGFADLANPLDVDGIAFAISRALDRTPDQLARARAHAATFTWQRTARETLEVYKRALRHPLHLQKPAEDPAETRARVHG